MDKYKMNENLNQKIVDGVLQGYKNYVEERQEKKGKMLISSAYAWVKGNHIDDQTARICKEDGVDYNNAKAGYTWGYLQFKSDESKTMFILKKAQYFNENKYPAGRSVTGKRNNKNNDENYLKKLSRINSKVEFPTNVSLIPEDNEKVLRIFDDSTMKLLEKEDAQNFEGTFDRFYIVTYKIDTKSNLISRINVWMPNPADEKAYPVEDLTPLINSSFVDLTNIDTSVLANDIDENYNDSRVAFDFGIGIQKDKKEGQSDS